MKVRSEVINGKLVVIIGRSTLLAERRRLEKLLAAAKVSEGDQGLAILGEIEKEKRQAVLDFIRKLLGKKRG